MRLRMQPVKQSRRGVSLIELLVMMAGASILLGTVSVLIGLMFRSEQHSARKIAAALSADRLARQFRQDAHAALKAELLHDEKTVALQFELDGNRRVSYTPGDDRMRRTIATADGPERHDEYRIARSEWTLDLTHDGTLAELDCTRTDHVSTAELRIPALHVEAAVKGRKPAAVPAAPEVTP